VIDLIDLIHQNLAYPISGAHRAHIALKELKVPFKEVIIDLDRPRDPEYLAVNPRGLVPSISYKGEIYTESGPISWLLADAYPGKLVPSSSDAGGPQQRARIAFFVDTYFTKFQSHLVKLIGAKTEQEQESIAAGAVDALVKEVEPLLKNAAPFFGGSATITLAEVLTGSFVLRVVKLANAGVYPSNFISLAAEKAPNFWKWAQAVSKDPSVLSIFDEEAVISSTKARIAKARAAA
jgi:glutathione S-transferase